MDNVHISAIIEGICKKQGINYKSSNPYYTTLVDDAIKLGCIYQDLKIMLGNLQEIEDRHHLNPQITDALEKTIKELNDADHIIIRIAKEILKENDKSS
jgi:predicted extracellular nuclease